MYSLFTSTLHSPSASLAVGTFDNLWPVYRRYAAYKREYYRSRAFTFPNQHLFVKILALTEAAPYVSDQDYVDHALQRAPFVGLHLGLTGETSAGRFFSDILFGPNSTELILVDHTPFTAAAAKANWQSLMPIRVLKHPYCDGRLPLVQKDQFPPNALAVLLIHPALLAFQYRCYTLAATAAGMEFTAARYFLTRYAIPNSFFSQTDYHVFNAFRNAFYGLDLPDRLSHFKTPLELQRRVRQALPQLQNHGVSYETLLASLPAVFSPSQHAALQMPDFAPTYQIRWALWLTRLDDIAFLIALGGKRALARNRHHLADLQRQLRWFQRDQTFGTLPASIADSVTATLDSLNSL